MFAIKIYPGVFWWLQIPCIVKFFKRMYGMTIFFFLWNRIYIKIVHLHYIWHNCSPPCWWDGLWKPAQVRAPGLRASGGWNAFPRWGTQPASYLLRGVERLRSKTEVVMQVLAAKHVRVVWHVQLICDLKVFKAPVGLRQTRIKQPCSLFNPVLSQQEGASDEEALLAHCECCEKGSSHSMNIFSSCSWRQPRRPCQRKP